MPTPTGSPSPFKTPAQVEAEKVVAEFFRLKNLVQTDHAADLAPLEAILTGLILEGQIALIQEDRENNIIQQGEFTYAVTGSTVTDANEVEVAACTDTTGTELVDTQTGESVLDPDRNRHRSWNIEVIREGDTWKLSDFETTEASSCDS